MSKALPSSLLFHYKLNFLLRVSDVTVKGQLKMEVYIYAVSFNHYGYQVHKQFIGLYIRTVGQQTTHLMESGYRHLWTHTKGTYIRGKIFLDKKTHFKWKKKFFCLMKLPCLIAWGFFKVESTNPSLKGRLHIVKPPYSHRKISKLSFL